MSAALTDNQIVVERIQGPPGGRLVTKAGPVDVDPDPPEPGDVDGQSDDDSGGGDSGK
ncbi:hypothetical protein HY008_01850 [Candidatus Woesebacteria bacterium]|nr:hypothetical protein [Candidatus Woesebacteria bacterium]